MSQCAWDQRIRRANELSSVYPFAAEALRFYVRLAALQRDLYKEFERALAKSSSHLSIPSFPRFLGDELDIPVLVPRFSTFLRGIAPIAPMPLAQAAATLAQKSPAAWQSLMVDFWNPELRPELATAGAHDEPDAGEAMIAEQSLVWLFLQPYAQYLAARRGPTLIKGTPSHCPLCGAKPIVAVLRPEGDGAKKSLICMLCAHEWTFRRIYCPACGEERETQVGFYSAPEIAHVRVDVCETCYTYLKSVDMTKTALAVPIVDELATLPLDLWARENGYTKLQMNMLGI
jgi:formate dehydrogenase maturation protein FdhE